MRMRAALALALALVPALVPATKAADHTEKRVQALLTPFPRQRVSINAGWRFHLGPIQPAPPACPHGPAEAFPTNLSGVKCLYAWCGACPGLLPREQGYPSLDACRDACCADDLCGAWQWHNETDGRHCWTGTSCLRPEGDALFVGGMRTLAPQPSPSPAYKVPAAAGLHYDDAGWAVVDTPHDFVAQGAYREFGNEVSNSQGNLPKNVSWYRKHFRLPPAWEGSHIELYVEGAYSVAEYYLNGVQVGTHTNGYTSAVWRLDSVPNVALRFDGATDNVLAVFVDARMAHCTGWWYEGGGIFRNSVLTSTSQVRIKTHGVFATASVPAGGFVHPQHPRDGIRAPHATVAATAELDASSNATASIGRTGTILEVRFVISEAQSGAIVGAKTVKPLLGVGAADAKASLHLSNAKVWSVARPFLYTLTTTVRVAMGAVAKGGVAMDAVNTTFGVRSVAWSPDRGLLLNEQRVKMRGFCNHENFAGVGSAIPERINLFRLQQLRGGGGKCLAHVAQPAVARAAGTSGPPGCDGA